MKYLMLLLVACFFIIPTVNAQDTTNNTSTKTNPIIYADFAIGGSMGSIQGISYGGSLNYQLKKGLFTARISGVTEFETDAVVLAPFIVFPVIRDKEYLTEYALLYGLRSIKNGNSFSASVGISQNTHSIYYKDDNNQRYKNSRNYVGVPFEFNFLFFNNIKKRYRIFYVIPVSKPTGFGRSIGFKVSGNISKYSYASVGLVFGLGFHKQY